MLALWWFSGDRHPDAAMRLTLVVRPLILLSRGDVRVEARVPRDTDNRLLAITWSSDVGTAGETIRQLDGEDAAVLHTLWLPNTPPAHYLFLATLIDRHGKIAGRDRAEIHTSGADGDLPR